ncbi:endolytic transglycosylase MltG [Levilactobacillus zymae]|uniref:Endolytic murein transglycosylase n=1 Tax=Levilactobacillus zymae TaxID=267363 RepID=A0A1Y6JX19_9LACO|nr:aminodeoxychorismate lyase [Levilactobacillus zymae]SMS14497.1 FIG004453: protein YceG like [Levilactobacillus zymae]
MDNGTDPTPTRQSKGPKRSSFGRRIMVGVASLLVILAVAIGIFGYQYFQSALKPLDTSNDNVVQVHVPMGATSNKIGQILQDKKVVKSGMVFNYYVKSHKFTNFRAGYYQLKPSMTLNTIAKRLQLGGSAEPIQSTAGKVLVREGETVDQLAAEIPIQTDFTKKEFLSLMKDQTFFNQLAARYPQLLSSAKQAKNVRYRLEGYLAPATYQAGKKMTLKQLITAMVAKTDQNLQPSYKTIKKQKLTVQETLTLASLVEREGVSQTDRDKIAGVFLNRIDANMALQSDIAVQYALKTTKKNLTYKDLKVKSPYNLYIHTGYGPGPFDSPSVSSVKAVLHPAARSKNYYYFIANTKTGKVYFSTTYDQHQSLTSSLASDNK